MMPRSVPELSYISKVHMNQTDFNNLLDDDVVRVCLLLALDFVFMGFELRHVISKEVLNLVDDFSAWDNFPWVQHIWAEFHNRTSSTSNDSPVDNVFSDTSDFDHDSFSSFTENPDERQALIQQDYISVDFQRLESYVDNQNMDNHSMDFDHDPKPSCGSDNHVKTSVESDVDNQNVDSLSMDFDHDLK
ncbi:hypothetical protein Tco_0698631, partial [Tanacetum coccineum]